VKKLLITTILLAGLGRPGAAWATATNTPAGNWLGTLEAGSAKFRLLFKISPDPAGGFTAKMDSLDQGAREVPVDSVTFKDQTVRLELKAIQGAFEGALEPGGARMNGNWRQGPNTLPLVLERTAAAPASLMGPTTPPYRPPAYAKTGSYQEQEVTVGAGEWQLPGTLTLPAGQGPFPGVVLVHGSGPQDRDETIGPNKPFLDLALGLASQGIAVLRYEKRTRQYAARMASAAGGLTVREETVADALAAAALLRKTDRLAPGKVFVLGHSLGGMLAPRIAAGDPRLAGLIILAGAARPLEDLVLEQVSFQTSLAGELPPEARNKIADLKRQVAVIKSLSRGDPPPGLLLGAPAGYWLDLQGYAPPTAAQKLTLPMLVLQGEKDCQVNPKADFEAWRTALAGHPATKLKSYAALNHLFMEVAGPGTGAEYKQPGHVAESVIHDLAAWIKQH
jgi:dienelactone hydrolase